MAYHLKPNAEKNKKASTFISNLKRNHLYARIFFKNTFKLMLLNFIQIVLL